MVICTAYVCYNSRMGVDCMNERYYTRSLSTNMKTKTTKHHKTNDAIIREHLKQRLTEQHKDDKKVRTFDELGINHGDVRADIAVVNGVLHGYEIKSDRDTLYRLPHQAEAYSEVFDRMTIIVGRQHVCDALSIIPDWWGVMVARYDADSCNVNFSEIRSAERNPSLSSISIARLLWRDEALHILKQNDADHGVRAASRELVYERLAYTLPLDSLRDAVRDRLFYRPNWRLDQPLQTCGD